MAIAAFAQMVLHEEGASGCQFAALISAEQRPYAFTSLDRRIGLIGMHTRLRAQILPDPFLGGVARFRRGQVGTHSAQRLLPPVIGFVWIAHCRLPFVTAM